MSDHTVAHGTFVVDRTYNHPVAKLWAALVRSGQEVQVVRRRQRHAGKRLRVQARRTRRHRPAIFPVAPASSFDVLYQDIVPNSRIVYNYDMHMDDKKISVSLASVEFWPDGKSTRMKLTEYGLFLDGLDTVAQRREGTAALMDQLGTFLDSKK